MCVFIVNYSLPHTTTYVLRQSDDIFERVKFTNRY